MNFRVVNLCLIVEGYTSISVREPLADIIAQTKGANQNREPVCPLVDPHYATVSDDSGKIAQLFFSKF